MSTKQIASSTLWQVASQASMAALSILTVKFVAVGLSKELAGNYHSAYGFLQLFGILADFGLYAVAVREVSAAKDKQKVMGALIILRGIILLTSLLIALALVWLLPMWRGTPLPLAVTIAALVPLFTLSAGILRTVFQVHYKMQYVFIAEVSQRIVTVLIIGMLIFLGIRGSTDLHIFHLFLFAGAIGSFVLFLLSLTFASRFMKVRPQWDGELLKKLFLRAAPYGLAYLCVALYRQTDTTMIALLRPDFELQNAYYGFALRAVEMAFLFPTFLLNSTLPILSERSSKGEDTRAFLGKIFFAILLLGTTAFLFSFYWARPLMHLLTTDDYLSTAARPGSDTAIQLLSFSMLLNGIVLFAFYSLLTKHAWKPLVAYLVIGAVVSISLNIVLIPRLGFVGAAYASILTHVLLSLTLLPRSLKEMPLRFGRDLLTKWFLYSIALGAILRTAAPYLNSNVLTVFALIIMIPVIGAIVEMAGIRRILRF